MVLRKVNLISLLWMISIILLPLTFLLQVLMQSASPALLPYIVLSLIVVLSLISVRKIILKDCSKIRKNNIDVWVCLYVMIVFFHSVCGTLFFIISPIQALSSIVIFIFPVLFYYFFSGRVSESDLQFTLYGIAVAGLIVGGHFCYDTYVKMTLGQISEFSQKAFDYSMARSNLSEHDANLSRITVGYRSHGMLDSHSASGAWIVLGFIAALSVLPWQRRVLRRVVMFTYGLMILISMNFTNIISFFIIQFFVFSDGITFLKDRILWLFSQGFLMMILFPIIIVILAQQTGSDSVLDYMYDAVFTQLGLIFNTDSEEINFLTLTKKNLNVYWQHLGIMPFSLILGDGFSSNGMAKGGDIGWIESLATFGFPVFSLIILGLIRLIFLGLKTIKSSSKSIKCSSDENRIRLLQFSVAIIMLILINEGHYSVWTAKSILPIFFIALAIFRTFLQKTRIANN